MDSFCSNCGAPLPEGAQFCPRCGTPVVVMPAPADAVGMPAAAPQSVPAPVPAAVPPPRTSSRTGLAIGVGIAVVALGLIAWALLSGMPYSHEPKPLRPASQVVTEETAGPTGVPVDERSVPPAETVSRIGEPPGEEQRDTVATTAPPPQKMTPRPARTVPTETAHRMKPAPAPEAPAPVQNPISEVEAVNVLRGYVSSNRYYDTSPGCLGVMPVQYENRGYTLDVMDLCGEKGRFGRWRVDALTREVFVRQPDGRYLKP